MRSSEASGVNSLSISTSNTGNTTFCARFYSQCTRLSRVFLHAPFLLTTYFSLCCFVGTFGGSSLGARLSSAGSGALAGIMEEGRTSEAEASLDPHSLGSDNSNTHHVYGGTQQHQPQSSLLVHTDTTDANRSVSEGVNLLEELEEVSPRSDHSCLISSTPVVLDP